MRKACFLLLLLFASSALAQSNVTIDKLERQELGKTKMEVPLSGLIEGSVSSQDLTIYVMVNQPHLKGWELFPAVMDPTTEKRGPYRWRALCQFGKINGTGLGASYQVRAVAFDSDEFKKNGFPKNLSKISVKSETIVLKRSK